MYTMDRNIKEVAEKAENEPNAVADLALYQCGFLDSNTIAESKRFTELYKVNAKYAMDQKLYESKSRVELWNLRGRLFSTTKSRLPTGLAFFDPNPYIDAFLKLDQEIVLLCPKISEGGKLKDGEDSAENPAVWEKIEEARKTLTILGV